MEKDKREETIHVILRCRPMSDDEKNTSSRSCVRVSRNDVRVDATSSKMGQTPQVKSYTFDHVFGSASKQVDIYEQIVSPVIDQVLQGYNCTIFCYGMTGTGKTYTMEGQGVPQVWNEDSNAGIIPRSLCHLFEILQSQDTEFSLRVSMIEIYNEELFDLLASDQLDQHRLRVFDDPSKKGAVIVQGLSDMPAKDHHEAISLLKRGVSNRSTAATLLNAHSSRSHSIFTITIHMRENTVDGEELLKVGKLNLVDLAGSENIGRSGAVDKRAREACSINQSLLTLGRVIRCLVERNQHIPYRESKLTRMLQDSLGGRTKTSFIATIGPALCNLEETLNTLEYAKRAKNIKNMPEINQKLTKKALIREFSDEIEKLRRDLRAARDKNGVYIHPERLFEMEERISVQTERIRELDLTISFLSERTKELEEVEAMFEDLKIQHQIASERLARSEFIVDQHVASEEKLYTEASVLMDVTNVAVDDNEGLFKKLSRKDRVEQTNLHHKRVFLDHAATALNTLGLELDKVKTEHSDAIETLDTAITNTASVMETGLVDLIEDVCCLNKNIGDELHSVETLLNGEISELVDEVKADNMKLSTATDSLRLLISTTIQRLRDKVTSVSDDTRQICTSRLQSSLELVSELHRNVMATVGDYSTGVSKSIEDTSEVVSALVKEVSVGNSLLKERELSLHDDRKRKLALMKDLIEQMENALDKETTDSVNLLESHQSRIDLQSGAVDDHFSNFRLLQRGHVVTVASQRADFDGQLGHLSDTAKEVVDLCDRGYGEVGVEIGAMEEEVVKAVVSLGEQGEETSASAQESIRDLSQLFQNNMRSCSAVAKVAYDESQGSIDELGKSCNQALSRVSAAFPHVDDFITHVDVTTRNLAAELSTLDQSIQPDQPTGATPQRRVLEFPKRLTRTDPHDILKENFERQRLAESEESAVKQRDVDKENSKPSFQLC